MPKIPPILLTLSACALVLSACSDSAKDTHPQQLVSKRQAIFKQFTKALEPMGQVARQRKDYVKAEFVDSAQALQVLATQPWVYFTPDSNYPPTRAKPDVWSQPGEFKQAQQSYLDAVAQLAQLAASADLPAIQSAVNTVEKSCKNCHSQFRNER